MKKIILASNSPRRKEILQNAGINFVAIAPKCDEIYSKFYNEDVIKQNSYIKASMVFNGKDTVLAADTMVILNSVCLVKPRNIFEAFSMLKKLSNKTHFVVTSHTLLNSDKHATKISKSFVTFRKLKNFEIIKYILIKKPFDKAGSYGIQDFINANNCNTPPEKSFISKLEGSYFNVMGLDIDIVVSMLENF